MIIENFIELVKAEVEKAWGETGTILLKEVEKVNRKVVGLTIEKPDSGISPLVYLEEYYREYGNGRNLQDIISEILGVLQQLPIREDSLQAHLMEYEEWVKPRLRVKVINRERNQNLLAKVPHEDILDLSIVPYILLGSEDGEITSLVLDSMASMWNVTYCEILETAKENALKNAPATIQKMSDVILEMALEQICSQEGNEGMEEEMKEILSMQLPQEEMELYVITNQGKLNGAYVIFYDKFLSSLAEQMGADGIYLLPSSVHEMLALSSSEVCVSELQTMVQDVNRTTVSDGEYLSDSVYYYDRKTKELKIAS